MASGLIGGAHAGYYPDQVAFILEHADPRVPPFPQAQWRRSKGERPGGLKNVLVMDPWRSGMACQAIFRDADRDADRKAESAMKRYLPNLLLDHVPGNHRTSEGRGAYSSKPSFPTGGRLGRLGSKRPGYVCRIFPGTTVSGIV